MTAATVRPSTTTFFPTSPLPSPTVALKAYAVERRPRCSHRCHHPHNSGRNPKRDNNVAPSSNNNNNKGASPPLKPAASNNTTHTSYPATMLPPPATPSPPPQAPSADSRSDQPSSSSFPSTPPNPGANITQDTISTAISTSLATNLTLEAFTRKFQLKQLFPTAVNGDEDDVDNEDRDNANMTLEALTRKFQLKQLFPDENDDDDDDRVDSANLSLEALTKKFQLKHLFPAANGLGGEDRVDASNFNTSSSKNRNFDDDDSSALDDDSLTDSRDLRPLIAVTIGVALFLMARSPRAARRDEEATDGVPTTLVVDEDELVIPSSDAALSGGLHLSSVSDLRSGPRDIVIVTTAALPWMTGTAVNPLLRAVYLAEAGHSVSLMVPWLESPEDQRRVFPAGTQFATRDDQAQVILKWARDQVPDVALRVRFYEGVYSEDFGSILPLGDITALFGDDEPRDVCVLEEPEHLTWFHTGRRWTNLFRFCVGVVHTNYLEYAKNYGVFGLQRALFLSFLNKWVCRSYCHRVIKLSDAVQPLPHSVTCNVHGVRDRFIDIGRAVATKAEAAAAAAAAAAAPTTTTTTAAASHPQPEEAHVQARPHPQPQPVFERGAYFLGKMLWAKGYLQLMELLEAHHARTDERLRLDLFGAGPDLDAVRSRVRSTYALSRIDVHGVVLDHACEYIQKYKVYVNPSESDVVCTATAEALAMGKFVVCLEHPSNEFFATFPNCLVYRTPEEFSSLLAYALANNPAPLTSYDAHRLSWAAATERFYDAARVDLEDVAATPTVAAVDSALALTHKTICATLVTPPANNAVRARYKRERRVMRDQLARIKRAERERRRQRRRVPVS